MSVVLVRSRAPDHEDTGQESFGRGGHAHADLDVGDRPAATVMTKFARFLGEVVGTSRR